MYEKRGEKPISRNKFYKRLLIHLGIAGGLIIFSLVIGICGLMYFEGISLHNAFLHSAMLLSGLGLVKKPNTEAGNWFVGLYGLYSGLVFIVSLTIIITPTLHRLIHKFHWSNKDNN